MRILINIAAILFLFNLSYAQDQGPEMVMVEGGEFYMGNDYSANSDERPEHQISLASFFISKYEVTVDNYAKYCRVTGHRLPEGDPETPINNITWKKFKMIHLNK